MPLTSPEPSAGVLRADMRALRRQAISWLMGPAHRNKFVGEPRYAPTFLEFAAERLRSQNEHSRRLYAAEVGIDRMQWIGTNEAEQILTWCRTLQDPGNPLSRQRLRADFDRLEAMPQTEEDIEEDFLRFAVRRFRRAGPETLRQCARDAGVDDEAHLNPETMRIILSQCPTLADGTNPLSRQCLRSEFDRLPVDVRRFNARAVEAHQDDKFWADNATIQAISAILGVEIAVVPA